MKGYFVGLLLVLCSVVRAQHAYFVLIEDAQRQPFYLRMGERSISSSAGGHLILSPLRDSAYQVFIGFPNSRAEQLFYIDTRGKDRGFRLRNITGQWVLSDMQSLQQLRPVGMGDKAMQGVKRGDSYSGLMADLVDDTAVLYGEVAIPANDFVRPRKDTVIWEQRMQTVIAKDTTAVKGSSAVGSDGLVYDKRDIIRLRTEVIAEGREVIYVDRSGPVSDTIRIVIPRL